MWIHKNNGDPFGDACGHPRFTCLRLHRIGRHDGRRQPRRLQQPLEARRRIALPRLLDIDQRALASVPPFTRERHDLLVERKAAFRHLESIERCREVIADEGFAPLHRVRPAEGTLHPLAEQGRSTFPRFTASCFVCGGESRFRFAGFARKIGRQFVFVIAREGRAQLGEIEEHDAR
jgi:hypothetical protein